jgi:hypothetical protein
MIWVDSMIHIFRFKKESKQKMANCLAEPPRRQEGDWTRWYQLKLFDIER